MLEDLQSGAITEAAAQPVETTPEAQIPQEQHVPIAALQAERQQRQQLQEQLRMMQDHVELLRHNQTQAQPQKDQFNDLSDDDVLTVGQAKKFVSQMANQQKAEVEELKMSTQYPDYAETVKKYLPELIKENPELRDAITNAPNPFKTAYILAKRSDAYLKDRGAERTPEAAKIAQQHQRAGNLSAVGSSTPASSVGSWKNMSDKDFMAAVQKNLGYA